MLQEVDLANDAKGSVLVFYSTFSTVVTQCIFQGLLSPIHDL